MFIAKVLAPARRRTCTAVLDLAYQFHASTAQCNLVAPPDPVSHMRPIIYDNPPSQLPAPYLRHPYSLSEFRTEAENDSGNHDLQYRLLRQQLDSLHQNFWLDVSDLHLFSRSPLIELPEQYSLLCCKGCCSR